MSAKFVLYRRDIQGKRNLHTMYLIKSQLQFGAVLNRVNEAKDEYTREVLAESDDLELLYRMKELAEGVEE